MSRINAPVGDNGGKNAFRHLNREELCMLARYAKKHGRQKTLSEFKISESLLRRACKVANVQPAPHKFLDLAAIAEGSKGMSRADAAAKFRVSESTVGHARRLHGGVSA